MIKLNIDGIETVTFTQSLIRVGRNKNISEEIEVAKGEEDADIFMRNKKAVSREHCEILKRDFQWFIKDLGSTNGTFLNNKRLEENDEYSLRDRDTLSLGSDVCLCIELSADMGDGEHTHFEDSSDFDKTSLDFSDAPRPDREKDKTRQSMNEIYFLESLSEEHRGSAFKLDFSRTKQNEFLKLLNIHNKGEINFIFSGSNIVLENRSSFQIKVNNRDIDREKILFDGNLIDIDNYRFIFVERTSRRIISEPIESKPISKNISRPKVVSPDSNYIKTRVVRESISMDNEPTISLLPSTMLNSGQYRVIDQLGEIGGFGITYLAEDTKLNSKVAIKEYFPRMYANRDRKNSVAPAESMDSQDNFAWGYDAFKKEAQTIANIPRHKNIIDVKNLFEENGTVYYVMAYTEGEDLESYLKSNHPLSQKEIEEIIFPLLEGVKHIHKHNILHRDIKLSNILITRSGEPILIDFGTARNQFIQRSKKLTTVYTEGYAAIEQHTGGNEGEYTDIYAIGMVVYAMINGITDTDKLPSSVKRLDSQHSNNGSLLKFPIKGKRISKEFIKAVKKSIEVQHRDRPQDVDALIKLFGAVQGKSSNKNYIFIGGATIALLIGLFIILTLS